MHRDNYAWLLDHFIMTTHCKSYVATVNQHTLVLQPTFQQQEAESQKNGWIVMRLVINDVALTPTSRGLLTAFTMRYSAYFRT